MARPGRARFWCALLLAGASAAASAHPVDELVQGSYLTLVPGGVRLELELTPGTQVAHHLLPALDTNRDRRISDAEARAFAQKALGQMTLVLDGHPVAWRLQKVAAPDYRTFRLGGVLKVYALAPRPERAGPRLLRFANLYDPLPSRCIANIFLQPRGAWRVTGQAHSNDGRVLIVRYAVAGR